jgi:hypothetical protein
MRELIATLALRIFLSKGGETMMAMLFASRIILGKTTFDQVPAKLKKQVAEVLIEDCGMPELVPSEYGGTADAQ